MIPKKLFFYDIVFAMNFENSSCELTLIERSIREEMVLFM